MVTHITVRYSSENPNNLRAQPRSSVVNNPCRARAKKMSPRTSDTTKYNVPSYPNPYSSRDTGTIRYSNSNLE